MNKILSQGDLENVFLDKDKRKKQKRIYLSVLLWFVSFVFIFVALYTITNFDSLRKNISFWYKNDYNYQNNDNQPQDNTNTVIASNQNLPIKDIANDSIYIKSIDVTAPITWDVKNEPDIVSKNLENGVIQIKGTAHPGEIGNVFITGHSSNYVWAPGKFKSVFSLLNNLVVGDIIQIKYKQTDYLYKVTDSMVVKPTETSVMDQGSGSYLSLMTCTPVGTSLNRLIVKADQVYPDKKLNTNRENSSGQNQLPKVR